MSRGNKTTSIPRPKARSKKSPTKKTRSKIAAASDHTRPTPRSERIVPKILGRVAIGVGALVVLISFGNSFLVLPATSWFGQRSEVSGREKELEIIRKANDELQTEVDRLKTTAGVQDAARDELGFILAGESRRQIIGDNRAPVDLPNGWPYDLITQIVTINVAEVVVEASQQTP